MLCFSNSLLLFYWLTSCIRRVTSVGDNRRSNLRICTRRENSWNRHCSRSGKSRYKGVHWSEERGRFRATITFHGKRVHLGYFRDEVKAAKAYDKAARKHYGEFAYLNFPEEEDHCKSSCLDVKL
ncbi:MAG: hypothetical protein KAT00_08370 [Planctomycetes bacterium]|nr:hypothetical protein [Planctomycetota bacterium]